MVAAGIFHVMGISYDWHANIQLSNTEASYADASNRQSLMNKQYPSDFWHAELPAVTRRDLIRKQMLCFDMVIEAVRNENQFLLLMERQGLVSHTIYVEFLPHLVVKMLSVSLLRRKRLFLIVDLPYIHYY